MADFRENKMIFFLVAILQLTGTGEYSSLVIRDGVNVTLPSGHVVDDGSRCGSINWIWRNTQNPVDLVRGGRILPNPQYSGRLSLTANCSLVLKTVTEADVGVYYCQLISSGQENQVELSIIQLTKHEDGDEVVLVCSVSSIDWCRHKVRWIYDGTDERQTETSQTDVCKESVRIPAGKLHLPKCEVTDGYSSVKHLFGVNSQPSLNKAGMDATGTSTTAPKSTTRKGQITRSNSKKSAMDGWWLYLIAAVGAVIFILIIIGLFIWWKKKKGKKTKTGNNTEDPEVSYASVSYTKRTSSKAQVQVKTDKDEGDTVTYSTLKVSSSSAGPPADHATIYATVNKPWK
ncbi:uncharacterized protein LOC121521409 isoform X2 [Cheilinus undulatus]|uniref:uncharacterized protein LOC121521409 isoform X2 n=1 Tax=Cheilinus undulatus TaxID=241271 RepID=UPI001BD4DDF1|nr:uncharacterized protein LOC121521409 isoform X2 [Cheilinus undulatus]